MGKQSRARRRRRRKRRRAKVRDAPSSSKALVKSNQRSGSNLRLRMLPLELARGHDGFLRGMPEPVVILGIYCDDTSATRLVGRFIYRFRRPGRFPCKVPTLEPSAEEQLVLHNLPARFTIVALAVEEDSGDGVQMLFAGLERGDQLVVWTDDTATATPLHLDELPLDWQGAAAGHRLHLMLDGNEPEQGLRGDDWVAANILVTDDALRKRQRIRLRFVSADARNDWTTNISFAIRQA